MPANTVEVSSSAEEPFELGDERVFDGLRVIREPTGRVTIRGTDRWGRDFGATYENETYFRNAIDTMRRSLTEAQGEKLTTLAQHFAPIPEGTTLPRPPDQAGTAPAAPSGSGGGAGSEAAPPPTEEAPPR